MTKRADVKRCDLSVEEWADKQTFTSTEQIHIPDLMADRVIGQEDAVEVMRKAASQKRHVMLIGEPGTGKSMLANSMVEYLPKEDLPRLSRRTRRTRCTSTPSWRSSSSAFSPPSC